MFDRVRSWLSGLLLGALFASGASAQGPWYVDGVSGVDAPGRGTTLATPWKTIGYAMAQASPATTGTNVVYVAGGQTYGAATNGETFPVVMRPGLALQGFSAGSSGLPVLQIPTGATGVEFTSTQNDQIVTNSVRGLTLSGGATGIAATSGASISHDSLVENCRFLGQQSQGVVLTALGLAQLSSVVRSCTFVGCGAGIEHGGWGMIGNTIVEDCVFQQMSRLGISTSGYFVAQGRVSGCRFEAGTIGVEVMGSALNLQFVVENSTFQMQSSTGVKLTTGLAGLNAIVRDSKFTGCRKGVEVLPGAPAQVDIQSNTFVECQEGSYCAYGGRSGVLDVYYEGNVFIGCGTGTTILGFVDASIKRDRFQGCQTGLNCLGGELPTVRIRASSASFVRNNVGLNLVWVYDSILDGLTIADNVAGLQSDVVYSFSPAYSGLSGFVQGSECRNSVFSGNGTDLRDLGSGQPPYVPGNTYGMIPLINFFFNCCFQGTNTVANGNLGLTDPLLSRPTYKLLPGSPCIDRVAPSATTPLYDFEGDPRVVVAGGSSATLLDIGADEFVPQGSARPYGTPGIGKGLLFPRISSPNTAVRYGTNLTLDLTGAISQLSGQAASSALLTFGWDDDSGVLPMDLGVFGLSGSLLWNDFVTTFPIQPVTAAGTASYTTAIPNNQALVGLTSTYQWFALMPGGDIVSSNGLRATIGQ